MIADIEDLIDRHEEEVLQEVSTEVNNPQGAYYFAESGNLAEALGETISDSDFKKDAKAAIDKLAALVAAEDHEGAGKQLAAISKGYWTTWRVIERG